VATPPPPENEIAGKMDAEATPREQPGIDGERGELYLAELSNAMVALYKELFGRGPTKCRTSYAGPNLIVSTLENTLTRAEQNMAQQGDHKMLRDLRTYFQYQYENEFVGAVERITGRTVRGFVSGIDTKQDIATEAFYLEPVGQPIIR
jgi:uncharacterized protein YbcI